MTQAIILTTQRTGSTFLVTCLDTHPEVCCRSELLAGASLFRIPDILSESRYGTKAYRYLRSGAFLPTRIMRRYLDEARIGPFDLGLRPVMAFKVMYNQIRLPWTLEFLRKRTGIRILHLRRENLLKAYVSSMLLTMKRENRWQPHVTAPVAAVRMKISGNSAIESMRRSVAEYDRHERIFCDHARLPLSYETMIDGQGLRAGVGREICDFLEIADHPMQSSLVKMNPERLADMVANYEEFARAIRKTEFAAMLD